MKQKLVLLIDSLILARAKKYGLKNRIDLSELVETFAQNMSRRIVKIHCLNDIP